MGSYLSSCTNSRSETSTSPSMLRRPKLWFEIPGSGRVFMASPGSREEGGISCATAETGGIAGFTTHSCVDLTHPARKTHGVVRGTLARQLPKRGFVARIRGTGGSAATSARGQGWQDHHGLRSFIAL